MSVNVADIKRDLRNSCNGDIAAEKLHVLPKAVCDVCHEEYGEKDMDNHIGAEEWIQTADTHEKKWNCCGRVSVESEPHDWVNGICSECGYVCLHTDAGKAATCKDKAVCKVCGESFGELDANNHADLKHITAKAATKDAEGNIEYWYCDGCDKYYSDATASKEISKADTVISKLPAENDFSTYRRRRQLYDMACIAFCQRCSPNRYENGQKSK